jgi:hypothetical protein
VQCVKLQSRHDHLMCERLIHCCSANLGIGPALWSAECCLCHLWPRQAPGSGLLLGFMTPGPHHAVCYIRGTAAQLTGYQRMLVKGSMLMASDDDRHEASALVLCQYPLRFHALPSTYTREQQHSAMEHCHPV